MTATAILGQAPQPGQPTGEAFTRMLVPMVLVCVIFYFAMLRPQQKKAKEHAEQIKTVRPGDKIVTTGGVVGVIISVKEKTLSVRSADSKFEITKSAIAEITERGGETSESAAR